MFTWIQTSYEEISKSLFIFSNIQIYSVLKSPNLEKKNQTNLQTLYNYDLLFDNANLQTFDNYGLLFDKVN